MSKFTFICEHDDIHGHTQSTVTYMTDKEYLQDVLEDFELFLRGCGFVFDGNLDFVEESYTPPTKGCGGCGGGCNAD